MRTIRDASPVDAAALCEAEREIVRAHDGLLVSEPDELVEEAFRIKIEILSNGSGRYLVAEVGGHAVAHASLWPMGLRKISHVLAWTCAFTWATGVRGTVALC